MNVTEHQRPGVYSVYDASSVVSGRSGSRAVGLAALCTNGTAGQAYSLFSREQAAETFGEEEKITKLVGILLKNGAASVWAVPVAAENGYTAAFAALEKVEKLAAVICDSTTLTVQQALRDSVKSASEARRERLAVVCGGEDEAVAALVSRAESLNCERVVLSAPGGAEAAAAVAGAIAGESDPAVPLGGAELKGIFSAEQEWTDREIDTLVLGGVTPLESSGGVVSVVRGVTTRTKTGSAADNTWRELTTIRVVDDVIPGLRDALRARFSRAKNTEQGRGAIRSQVIVELEQKKSGEIITGYDNVTVSAVEDNPAVCLVEFDFTVAHGLNQIWLSAHVTV
ncbi:MAG: phage tail sheath subtilisin-like domain-containing protein [Pseudoflavonifractor sp.]|nr:phage tail sheath subtilisin-like domain-containing protein [Pseudoflavonifractor sp.]